MSLPVERILWAPTNSAHHNHLHVVGDPRFTGTPPPNNPGMSDAIWTVYVALAERFGEPAYFLDADGSEDWTHMGWYNRRYIGGTTTWSQHSWSNALDIGPYDGVEEQQKFYDFLTGKEETMTKDEILKELGITKWDLLTLQQVNQGFTDAKVDRKIIPATIENAVELYRSGGGSGGGLQRGDSVTLT